MNYISPINRALSPFAGSSFGSLEKEFLSLFDNFAPFFVDEDRSARSSWYENDDAYVARIDLPGVRSKDISVELEEGVVSISAERKSASKKGNEQSFTYTYSLTVPEEANGEEIAAAYEDGVLSLTFPKSEKVKPVKIQVS